MRVKYGLFDLWLCRRKAGWQFLKVQKNLIAHKNVIVSFTFV